MFKRPVTLYGVLWALWPKRWLEWAVIAGVAIVLALLLLPSAQWAMSGEDCYPVEVLVFDAASGTPVAGAQVSIQRGAFTGSKDDILRWTHNDELTPQRHGATADNGVASLEVCCPTGASGANPEPRAHLQSRWVIVNAEGYGKVMTPVRMESVLTKKIKEEGKLLVPVGLFRVDETE